MGWLETVFGGAGPKTFEQDLDKLIGRWLGKGLGRDQVAVALSVKARQLAEAHDNWQQKIRPSQGA